MFSHTDSGHELDLFLDLHSMDETGLPWGYLRDSAYPERIKEGAWIIAGTPDVWVVARVVDVVKEAAGEIVHVQPQRGAGSKWLHLLSTAAVS